MNQQHGLQNFEEMWLPLGKATLTIFTCLNEIRADAIADFVCAHIGQFFSETHLFKNTPNYGTTRDYTKLKDNSHEVF